MKICKYLCCCASRCFQWRNKSVLLSHLTNKETKGQRDVKQGAPLAARGPQEPGFAETLWPCLARRQPRIMARGQHRRNRGQRTLGAARARSDDSTEREVVRSTQTLVRSFIGKWWLGFHPAKRRTSYRRSPRLPTSSQPADLGEGQGHKAPRSPGTELFSCFLRVLFYSWLACSLGWLQKSFKSETWADSQLPPQGGSPQGCSQGRAAPPTFTGCFPSPALVLNAGVNSPCWGVGTAALLHL